jgi:hypothetical protein
MKTLKTILFFILPALVGMYLLFNVNSAFADAHHINGLYACVGWGLLIWCVLLIVNAFIKIFKYFNE